MMVTENEVVHQEQNEVYGSPSSFQIIPIIEEHSSDVVKDQIEITTTFLKEEKRPFVNTMSGHRDTSDTTTVRFELNDTRDSVPITCRQSITVNTHDSILDLESQGGDDDMSFCDDDLLGIINLSADSNTRSSFASKSPKRSSKKSSKKKVRPVSPDQPSRKSPKPIDEETKEFSGIMGSLSLYSVTDSFVDSICTSTACVVSDNYNMHSTNLTYKKESTSAIDSMDDKISQFQQSCSRFEAGDAGYHSNATETENPSKAMVSMDIWDLLGCSSPPGESELEQIWSLRTPSTMLHMKQHSKSHRDGKQPVRASIKKRMKRIHRLRMDDRRMSGASRHGVTITNHCIDPSYQSLNNIRNHIHMKKNGSAYSPDNDTSDDSEQSKESHTAQPSYRAIEKSYSMLDDPLEQFIGKGMVEPIPVQVEDGYDSDPEVNTYSATTSMVIDSPKSQSDRMEEDFASAPALDSFHSPANVPQHRDVLRVNPIPTDEVEMRESVQQTLNSTWTLTWHPNTENRKEYNILHSKPICINMWLERGAVMTNSGVVVEPAFMWRDAYQPLLLTQHKLNNSSQKPWSMRLLNACRISPYFSSPNDKYPRNTLDRRKYPLARKNSSFLLKSCGGEEFLLEAKTPEDAIAITERWKLVVARFACLAVTEDVGGIAKEFFHPTSDSRMLTVPDPNNIF